MTVNPAERLAELHKATRIPPAELVGQVDKGFGKLDYMGHAAVTDLLLEHDPEWSWEPFALDEAGLPLIVRDSQARPRALWIRLTVCGQTRIGVGTCSASAGDPFKELIGDALRNAAMRFGVGLSLWAKEEWQDEGVESSRAGERPQTGTSGEEHGKDNASRPGRRPGKVTQLPRPSDDDVARHPAGGPLLRQDQAIAARAQQLGLDEPTRIDVIRALTGKMSGKDIEAAQVATVMRNMKWLADGLVALDYDIDGNPSIHNVVTENPGPSRPGQRVDG